MGQKASVAQEEENELFNLLELYQRHEERQIAKTTAVTKRTVSSTSLMNQVPAAVEHR